MERATTITDEEELTIAREGYMAARSATNWFNAVNACPYGPGYPNNPKACAWYRGFWFYYYIVQRWFKFINDNKERAYVPKKSDDTGCV